MSVSDVDALRTSGLDDHQITIAVQVIGYFNYINRVADALDVELEPWMKEFCKVDWLTRKGRFR